MDPTKYISYVYTVPLSKSKTLLMYVIQGFITQVG